MTKSLPRKILKVILWLIGILIGIVILVFLLLQVPAVQQRVAREVEKVARESLGTDLGIGTLDIDFPSRLEIDDFYLNNPAGDSIARVGHLGVGINMIGLLKSRVEITDVVLSDVFANIRTTNSTSNIAFLLTLGVTDSTAVASVPTDSSSVIALNDTTPTAAPWVIDAAGAEFLLERANIYYQDDPAGILADVKAKRLAAQLNGLDLVGQTYDIDYLELEGAKVLIGLGETSTPTDTTVTTAAAMQLLAGRMTIQETNFALKMAGMDIATELPYVNLEGADLLLGDEIAFNGEVFQLRDLALKLDTPAPPLAGPGIDYNHLDLSGVQAEATDIAYIVDSLHLRLRQLAAKEKSGLTVERSEGTVIYNPSFLGLEGFLFRTPNTELKSDNTAINYDFAAGDMADLIARLQLDGYLGLRDVALLAPDLAKIPVIGNNLAQQLKFSVRANGTMAAMQLSRIQLDGPGIKVRANGRIENALDVNNIAGRLNLSEFSVIPGPLLPLVPEGMLPPDIDWPEKVIAEGTADYRNDRLQMNFYAIENRQFGNGLLSRVKTNGVIEGVTTFPKTRLSVELDTLLATKATILAYVPPGTLPEDYSIPDFVRGSGTVSGPMDDLDVNLRLNLPGENTFASIQGNIKNALDPDNLNLDIAVSDLAISIADIQQILPDSMLPSNLNIPDLKIRNARISGSLTDLDFDVPLETDNGIWNLKGKYNPEDLDVSLDLQDIRIADLFVGPMRDTLQTLDLGPLNIVAQLKGRLEPEMNLIVDGAISNEAEGGILDFNALVEDGRYAADFNITHPEFLASGEGFYAIGPDSVAAIEALVDINRLNLQHWDITEVPMLVDGRLEAESKGLDPYNMLAFARLDSIRLRGAEGSSYVDSLVVRASLQDFKNEIFVRSDVLDAELLGTFDPVKTPGKMAQFIMAYWDESLRQPTPVENGEAMDFVFELKRPQPLTGGLVNGLTELSPFRMSLLYRDASPEFLVNLDMPEIGYAGLSAHDLAFRVVGDTVSMGFEADWSDINYNDQFELGRTVLSGESIDDELLIELKLYTEEDSLRHYLGFITDPESDTISIRLEEEQILNFETWTVPPSNLITVAGPSLIIRDFALRNGEQSLSAETTEPGDVVITFGDFNLRTPSRLLFSEEEVAAGIVNGTVGLDNALTNLGIQSDLSVNQLKWEGTLLGDVIAEVSSDDEQTYTVDVRVEEAGNNAEVTGTVELDGPLDLLLDVKKLQLKSAEPFSLGYLKKSEGFLSGRVDIGGTIEAPEMNGDLRFNDASLVISLLGERFRLDEKPITFRGQTISFGNDWKVYDSAGGAARVQGEVELQSVEDIVLDIQVTANDFLAINSNLKDNKDWYGKMFVDADVDISGTALLPIVKVTATTSKESAVTYVYRIAQQGLVESEGVVDFVEAYRWRDVIRRDTLQEDTTMTEIAGVDLTIDLDVDPNLTVTVVVDPISGQTFVGKADGDLTMRIYPDGRQEAVGRVELTEGKYDFIYQNVINKQFEVLAGSNVTFTGDLLNPQLDLRIRHVAQTSPLAHQKTLQRLADYNTFRYIAMSYEPVAGSDSTLVLNAFMQPRLRRRFEGELGLSYNSADYFGPNVKVAYVNRNLLRGAELLRVEGDFTFAQFLGSAGEARVPRSGIYGLSAKLNVPRLWLPKRRKLIPRVYTSGTVIEIGGKVESLSMNLAQFSGEIEESNLVELATSLEEDPEATESLSLMQLRAQFGYTWKRRVVNSHQLNPLSIRFQNPSVTTEEVLDLAREVNLAPGANDAQTNRFDRMLVFSPNYTLTNDTRLAGLKTHTFFWKQFVSMNMNNVFPVGVNAASREKEVSFYPLVETDFRYYLTFNKQQQLATRFHGGVAFPLFSDRAIVPYFDLFSIGGPNSLRGFAPRQVGPGRTVPFANNLLTFGGFGNLILEGSVEFRQRLNDIVELAVFADAGNIWTYKTELEDLDTDFKTDAFSGDIAVDAGVGVRFDLQFLILRIDLAQPLMTPYEEAAAQLVIPREDARDVAENNLRLVVAFGYPF